MAFPQIAIAMKLGIKSEWMMVHLRPLSAGNKRCAASNLTERCCAPPRN